MNYAVVYSSRTGNTKRLAEAIHTRLCDKGAAAAEMGGAADDLSGAAFTTERRGD